MVKKHAITEAWWRSGSRIPFVDFNDPALFLRAWNANNAFQDTGLTVPVAHGEEVSTIVQAVTGGLSATNNLVFVGATAGNLILTDETTYGAVKPKFWFRDPATLKGGHIFIPNTLNLQYQSVTITPNIGGTTTETYEAFAIFKVYRALGGTTNEQIDSVSRGNRLKYNADGSMDFGSFNISLNTGVVGLPDHHKLHVYEIIRYKVDEHVPGEAHGILFIDKVQMGGLGNLGTQTMTEHAYGTTSHPQDAEHYGSFIVPITGSVHDYLNSTFRASIYKTLSRDYPGLYAYPSEYPVPINPVVTWDDDNKKWTVAYTDNLAASGASIVTRKHYWYKGTNVNIASSVEVRTFIAESAELVRANYPSDFPDAGSGFSNVYLCCEVELTDADGKVTLHRPKSPFIRDDNA